MMVILAIAMWLFIFYATGLTIIASFLIVFGSGVVVYFIYAKLQHKWPYKKNEDFDLEQAVETIGE